jgi:hypothetical protein
MEESTMERAGPDRPDDLVLRRAERLPSRFVAESGALALPLGIQVVPRSARVSTNVGL